MFIVLSLLGFLYLLGLGALLVASYKAPEGFEDASGFRYGTEEEPAVAPRHQKPRERFSLEAAKRPHARAFNLRAT